MPVGIRFIISPPKGITQSEQKTLVDAINALNLEKDAVVNDPEIATRIQQYEMAFRMQASTRVDGLGP